VAAPLTSFAKVLNDATNQCDFKTPKTHAGRDISFGIALAPSLPTRTEGDSMDNNRLPRGWKIGSFIGESERIRSRNIALPTKDALLPFEQANDVAANDSEYQLELATAKKCREQGLDSQAALHNAEATHRLCEIGGFKEADLPTVLTKLVTERLQSMKDAPTGMVQAKNISSVSHERGLGFRGAVYTFRIQYAEARRNGETQQLDATITGIAPEKYGYILMPPNAVSSLETARQWPPFKGFFILDSTEHTCAVSWRTLAADGSVISQGFQPLNPLWIAGAAAVAVLFVLAVMALLLFGIVLCVIASPLLALLFTAPVVVVQDPYLLAYTEVAGQVKFYELCHWDPAKKA
jgi:hypothetical protein